MTPGAAAHENQWFGGPRTGTAELAAPGHRGVEGRWRKWPLVSFSSAERYALDEAIRKAEQQSPCGVLALRRHRRGRAAGLRDPLHNSLVAPARSILIMVDPGARALEIVTGGYVRRTLSDREVELAALEMQSAFAEGDLVGGLKRGIAMLAEHARPQNTLHAG